MSSRKLPPLELQEEVDQFKAYKEVTDLNFRKCSHKDVKYSNGQLRCVCGAAWAGSGIDRLYKALISQ